MQISEYRHRTRTLAQFERLVRNRNASGSLLPPRLVKAVMRTMRASDAEAGTEFIAAVDDIMSIRQGIGPGAAVTVLCRIMVLAERARLEQAQIAPRTPQP